MFSPASCSFLTHGTHSAVNDRCIFVGTRFKNRPYLFGRTEHEGIDFAIRHQVMNAAATLRFSAECSITISTQSEEALRDRGKGGKGGSGQQKGCWRDLHDGPVILIDVIDGREQPQLPTSCKHVIIDWSEGLINTDLQMSCVGRPEFSRRARC
jgi:hypothetical protein